MRNVFTDKEQITPHLDEETKRGMELLERIENGEIDQDELERDLLGNSAESEPKEAPAPKKKEAIAPSDKDLEADLDAMDNIDNEEESDEDLGVQLNKPITKSKKVRDRKKENILLDKMRIEQLEIEKNEAARQVEALKLQMQQHQQFIEQQMRSQQENQVASHTNQIGRLEREIEEAHGLYDHARAAKLSSELINLKVQAAIQQSTRQQPNAPQQQGSQPVQQQYQPSNDELLVQKQILGFSAKQQNSWTNSEYGPGATPLTADAQVLTNIINQVRNERGDWRTQSFWEIVEERAAEALPHKYSPSSTQAKNAPVGSQANKGSLTNASGNTKDPLDIEVANIIKSAIGNGLRFKTREDQRDFIRQTKKSVMQQRGLI